MGGDMGRLQAMIGDEERRERRRGREKIEAFLERGETVYVPADCAISRVAVRRGRIAQNSTDTEIDTRCCCMQLSRFTWIPRYALLFLSVGGTNTT